jgi:hypothetical protein
MLNNLYELCGCQPMLDGFWFFQKKPLIPIFKNKLE